MGVCTTRHWQKSGRLVQELDALTSKCRALNADPGGARGGATGTPPSWGGGGGGGGGGGVAYPSHPPPPPPPPLQSSGTLPKSTISELIERFHLQGQRTQMPLRSEHLQNQYPEPQDVALCYGTRVLRPSQFNAPPLNWNPVSAPRHRAVLTWAPLQHRACSRRHMSSFRA